MLTSRTVADETFDSSKHKYKVSLCSSGAMNYLLPYKERCRLHNRAYYAQQRDHSEVCGLLIVNSGKVIELSFLKNYSDRPGHWEILKADIKTVRRQLCSDNRIIGTFHSHPISEAIPSTGDLVCASINSLMLIYDVCGRSIKLWRIKKIGDSRIPIEIQFFLETRNENRIKAR